MPPSISTCSIAFALLVGSTGAAAQTQADSIQALVKNGQRVSITTDAGDEIVGKIGSMTADGLSITDRRERATIPYRQIVKIDHPPDGLANGAKIGFVVGAAFALAAIVADDAGGCPEAERAAIFGCDDPGAVAYVVGPLLLGGLGSALGVGIDALIRRDPQIYKRGPIPHVTLAPWFGPRAARGAVLSVSW